MNKRIIELARQSGGIDMTRHADTTNRWGGDITTWIGTGTPEFLERFAELIVLECTSKIEDMIDDGWYADTEELKKHFGVE